MQAQKELQPKIQELQKKYGKDREKLSQAQMKLYQEAGVNPLSGCLPLIVQMPIPIWPHTQHWSHLDLRSPMPIFIGFPDLGFPEYTYGLAWISDAWNAGEYQILAAYLVLPVLLMASQFIMQKWMTPTTPPTSGSGDGPLGGMAGMTKQLSLMMTFMFGFFTLQVPAGLTLYWVTSNLLQLLQQWAITSDRFGLTPATAGATSAGGTTVISDTSDSPGNATNNEIEISSTSNNGITPAKEPTSKKKPKRRRRAKREIGNYVGTSV